MKKFSFSVASGIETTIRSKNETFREGKTKMKIHKSCGESLSFEAFDGEIY